MGSMPSSPDIPKAQPAVAPTTPEDESVRAAGDAVRRRIRAQQGRQSTFIVPLNSTGKRKVGDA